MSITVTPEQRYDCERDGCDETRTRSTSVGGSYCSRECYNRSTGSNLLRDIRQDHRFCWSCWRARKEIERPTAESRRGLGPITDDALVGYEYYTEHAEMGPYGLECACGAVSHDIDDYDRLADGPYHWFLKLAFEQMVDEGQRDGAFDLVAFANAYWETDDLELAVGRAIE